MRLWLMAGLVSCAANKVDTGGVDDSGQQAEPLSWPVGADGPFGLGHLVETVQYTTVLGTTRDIPVHVWYPTTDTAGTAVTYSYVFPDPRALGGATPAESVHASGYPVLVHSHGHFGVAGGVALWAHRLVSHGWVVIAPEHIGDTLEDGITAGDTPSPTAHYIERPNDVVVALDAVAGGSLLPSPLSTERVALSGHSRGTYTAWVGAGGTLDREAVAAACTGASSGFPTGTCTDQEREVLLSGALNDQRFRATLLLAGTIRRELFGETGHRSAHSSFLAMTGSADSPDGRAQFDSADGLDFTWLEVSGGCHETFNLGVEASTLQPCPTFDTEQGWSLTATYSLAFLRHQILDDEQPETLAILSGDQEVDASVSLERRVP